MKTGDKFKKKYNEVFIFNCTLEGRFSAEQYKVILNTNNHHKILLIWSAKKVALNGLLKKKINRMVFFSSIRVLGTYKAGLF